MNTRMIVMASFAALAMGMSVPTIAAAQDQNPAGGAGMMQSGQESGSTGQGEHAEGMMEHSRGGGMAGGHWMRGGGMMGGGMMGGGMMGGGMMGMMSACPAMTGAGLEPKAAMRMHGEMMRAIGDILVKYADQVQPSAAKP